jgi:hypothetical protein
LDGEAEWSIKHQVVGSKNLFQGDGESTGGRIEKAKALTLSTMFHFPIGLHFHNTNSDNTLRIL